MKFPKFVLASDGNYTGLLLDNVFFGQGIKRLDFSTENNEGKMKATIHIMDIDIGQVSLDRPDKFYEFVERLGKTADSLDGFKKTD